MEQLTSLGAQPGLQYSWSADADVRDDYGPAQTSHTARGGHSGRSVQTETALGLPVGATEFVELEGGGVQSLAYDSAPRGRPRTTERRDRGPDLRGVEDRTLVPAILDEYGSMTKRLIEQILPDVEPRKYLYELVADYPRRGGRGMRPSLCMATARAFGAPVEQALHTAASIEMIHNAALIHDDIQDESEMRRGQPTLHHKVGIPLALNAGDALLMLAVRPLIANTDILGPQMAFELLRETEKMCIESAEGQALDIGWRRDNVLDTTDEDYLRMVLKKTCWLAIIHPLRTGALIATQGRADLENLTRLGFFLGAAFQIQDDLLNLVGDEEKYGKELNGDIREGKRTLMTSHVYRHATPRQRKRLSKILGCERSEKSDKDVLWVRKLMDEYGSIEYAREVAHGLAGAALFEWNEASRDLPPSRDSRFIKQLPIWVIERR